MRIVRVNWRERSTSQKTKVDDDEEACSRNEDRFIMRHATFKRKNGCGLIFLALALFRVRHVSAVGASGGRWTPSHRTVPKPWSSSSSSSRSTAGLPSPLTRSSSNDDNDTQSTFPIDTRGGQSIGRPSGNLEKTVEAIVEIVTGVCGTVLPPVVACARLTIRFYRSLPVDFIVAQVGLVYCFAGGYYPTLFAALTAAQQCGWQTMLYALEDLIEEATIAIEAASREVSNKAQSYRDAVTRKTMVVLAAIDPVKVSSSRTHRILCVLRIASRRLFIVKQFNDRTVKPIVSPTCSVFITLVDQYGCWRSLHNLVGSIFGLGKRVRQDNHIVHDFERLHATGCTFYLESAHLLVRSGRISPVGAHSGRMGL
jgi:hypothetical protein